MSSIVVFDTSVLVDDLRTGCHKERIERIAGLIRLSSVVLAELWRGATGSADLAFVRALERNHGILTPTEKNWRDSGMILTRMRADRGYTPGKLRDLHFDVLIALTARTHGARLITSNRNDFEAINSYQKIQLEIW